MFADLVTEVAGMDDDALLTRLAFSEDQRRRQAAEDAVLLAEIERRRLYRQDGHASAWGLLRGSFGWSNTECLQRTRLARMVAAHGDVGESMFEGGLPVAHAVEIARGFANPRCGGDIQFVLGTLLTDGPALEFDEFRTVVQRWEMLADIDGAHRDRGASYEQRNAHLCITADGVGRLDATWGDYDAARASEVFERFCDAEFMTDWAVATANGAAPDQPVRLPRTSAQRRADALLAIFLAAAAAPPDGVPADPVGNLLIDETTFGELLVEAGLAAPRHEPGWPSILERRCETVSGVPIDPRTALAVLVEGRVRRVVCDRNGVVVNLGRTQRLFTGAAREAVLLQATRCRWKGCAVPHRRLQADHVIPWAAGQGRTDVANGDGLCGGHNRLKRRGYAARRDSHGHWRFYRPDGSEIT